MSDQATGKGPNPYYGGNFDGESNELANLRRSQAKAIDELRAEVERLTAEVARLRGAHTELSRYFISGNCVPVERAMILAEDFWRIVGTDYAAIAATPKGE